MKKYIKGLSIGMAAISVLSIVSIRDIITNKDTDKMVEYNVYVEKGDIDMELANGMGILISKDGVEILPVYK